MSRDHQLANELVCCSRKNDSYIANCVKNYSRSLRLLRLTWHLRPETFVHVPFFDLFCLTLLMRMGIVSRVQWREQSFLYCCVANACQWSQMLVYMHWCVLLVRFAVVEFQLFVIVWFVHRISGAHLLENLQAIRHKTTTSLPQVKVTEVLLWSSPEMRSRETIQKMCSLWYDHSNVNIFHAMENCEEKLCSWLKIRAKNMLSEGPTKSGLNSQKSRYGCRTWTFESNCLWYKLQLFL